MTSQSVSPHFEQQIDFAVHSSPPPSLLESTFPVRSARFKNPTAEAAECPKKPNPSPSAMPTPGLDISRGDRAKDRIKFLAQKTFNRNNVLGGIGGFGALFRLDLQALQEPYSRQLGRWSWNQAQDRL